MEKYREFGNLRIFQNLVGRLFPLDISFVY